MKASISEKQKPEMLVGRTVRPEESDLSGWKRLTRKLKNLIEERSKSNLDKKMRGPGWPPWA